MFENNIMQLVDIVIIPESYAVLLRNNVFCKII